MTKFSLLFIFILLSAGLFSQTIYVSGNISTNTTWSADSVMILDDVIIDSNVVLTIIPGTYIEAQGFFKIDVKGRLIATGTPSDSIYFTIDDTTGFYDEFSVAGGWDGIHFDFTPSVNDTSIFEYCSIKFGKSLDAGGGMHINGFSKIIIRNCYIADNYAIGDGGGIWCNNASPVITDNHFYYNNGMSHGGGICFNSGPVTISGNTFIRNMTSG